MENPQEVCGQIATFQSGQFESVLRVNDMAPLNLTSLEEFSGLSGEWMSENQVWVLLIFWVCVGVVCLGLHVMDRVRRDKIEWRESEKKLKEFEFDQSVKVFELGIRKWDEEVRRAGGKGGGGKGGLSGV